MTPISISEGPSSIPSSSNLHVHRADEPLLPAVEGHKPWLTKFKVPSHATASIRYGHISTDATASSSTSSTLRTAQAGPADDDRTRRKEREVKKRSEIVGRLTRAKESTLDYRLGMGKNIKSGTQARPNPVSVKGWAGLVEARIEVRCVPSMITTPDPSLFHPASKTRRTLPHYQGPREAP
jgi:DnaJ family protein C protein 28